MPITVTFEFTPKQKVITPWGDMGVVTDAAINEDLGQEYFVQRDRDSQWIRGELLQNAGDAQPPIDPPGPLPPFPRDFPPYGARAETDDQEGRPPEEE